MARMSNTVGGSSRGKGLPVSLDVVDIFMISITPNLSVDLQMIQLEDRVLFEISQNPVEGPDRMIVSAGYVARVLMREHDLDPDMIEARANAFMDRLARRAHQRRSW